MPSLMVIFLKLVLEIIPFWNNQVPENAGICLIITLEQILIKPCHAEPVEAFVK